MSREPNFRRLLPFLSLLSMAALVVGRATLADEAQDEPAEAKSCIYQNELRRTKVLNDRNILFVTRKGQTYANTLPRSCPSMRRGSLLNYAFENRRICAGSTFQVILDMGYQRVPTFICPLGMFVPISDDEADALIAMTSGRDSSRRRRRSERDMVETRPVELPAESDEAAP